MSGILLQTDLYRPAEEAFRAGALAMSDQARRVGEAMGVSWGDHPLNWALVIVSALAFAFSIPSLYHIFPHIVKSFSRWRWNLTIEASLQLARTRDGIALLCVLPFCLIFSRYWYALAGSGRAAATAGAEAAGVSGGVGAWLQGLDLWSRVPEGWFTLAVLGLLVTYFLLRTLIYLLLETRAAHLATFQVARKAERNFFISLTFILLAGVGILYAFQAAERTIRLFILVATGLVYLVFLFRKGQILGSVCAPLTTFLYLCALEFLPTGLLIAACLLL